MTGEEELALVIPLPAVGVDPLVCPTATSIWSVRFVLFESLGSHRQAQLPASHLRSISFSQVVHAFLIEKYFQLH